MPTVRRMERELATSCGCLPANPSTAGSWDRASGDNLPCGGATDTGSQEMDDPYHALPCLVPRCDANVCRH